MEMMWKNKTLQNVAFFFILSFKGYTIPLDKRLAADGRGLQTVHINENFAKLAEALYIADRKVCCMSVFSDHERTSIEVTH